MPKFITIPPHLHHAIFISLILAMVFAAYVPALQNGFVSWDDDVQLYDNITVRSLDREHIGEIFTRTVNKIYIPLTMLSYAVEYRFFGYDPFRYHLDNVLLHLAVVAMIYGLGLRLGLTAAASGIAALLFGIHPMHVESVAWVTERKDVLYAFFYMGALLSYSKYLDFLKRPQAKPAQKSYGFLVLTVVFGILSMLAKPMALSLPLVLALLDWFYGRRVLARDALLEKVPLALLVAGITWISYVAHMRLPGQSIMDSPLIWVWTFAFYPRQFIFPTNLLPLYTLPKPVGITQVEYLLPVVFLGALLMALVRFRRHRWFVFAVFFYFFSIFFLLRFDEIKDVTIVADRFMYLPSLGLCFLAGHGVQRIWERNDPPATALAVCLIFIAVSIFFYKTNQQGRIWKDSTTLWRYQLESNPDAAIPYNNLAIALQDRDEYKRAEQNYRSLLALGADMREGDLSDTAIDSKNHVEHVIGLYERAIKINPGFTEAYYNLGKLYDDLGKSPEAITYYMGALLLEPQYKDAHTNLGDLYRRLGDAPRAVFAFDQVIRFNPDNEEVYFNIISLYNKALKEEPKNSLYMQARGKVMDGYIQLMQKEGARARSYFNLGYLYSEMGDVPRAISAYERALDINPKDGKVLYNLGNIYKDQGRLGEALEYYKRTIKVDPRNAEAHLNMGVIYQRRGNGQEAKESFQKAVKVDPNNARAYFNLGVLEESVGNLQQAIELYRKSIAKDPESEEAYYNLGNSYARLRRNKEAIDSYLTAVKLDTNYMDAWVNLSILSYKEGDFSRAVKYCDEAILLGYKAPQEYLNALMPYRN